MNQLIAIDSGKHTTKSVVKLNNNIQKFSFRTKVQEVSNLGVELSPNNFLIEFCRKLYLIGDMVNENKCNYDISKESLEHKLCIYLSIANYIEKSGAMKYGIPNIFLAINAPLNMYKNNILKSKYIEYLKNNNEVIQIKINGKLYVFKISTILVLPEALGPIYLSTDNYKNKRVAVIDIGSLNVNYCFYENLIPQIQSMSISNQGINILRAKIAETLTSQFGVLISDADVEQIIKDGYLYVDGAKLIDSKLTIDKLINEHVQQIFNYAKSREFTFNNTEIVIVGGGAILLSNAITDIYSSAIIYSDAQYTNVLSFFKILEIKYGQS